MHNPLVEAEACKLFGRVLPSVIRPDALDLPLKLCLSQLFETDEVLNHLRLGVEEIHVHIPREIIDKSYNKPRPPFLSASALAPLRRC